MMFLNGYKWSAPPLHSTCHCFCKYRRCRHTNRANCWSEHFTFKETCLLGVDMWLRNVWMNTNERKRTARNKAQASPRRTASQCNGIPVIQPAAGRYEQSLTPAQTPTGIRCLLTSSHFKKIKYSPIFNLLFYPDSCSVTRSNMFLYVRERDCDIITVTGANAQWWRYRWAVT